MPLNILKIAFLDKQLELSEDVGQRFLILKLGRMELFSFGTRPPMKNHPPISINRVHQQVILKLWT